MSITAVASGGGSSSGTVSVDAHGVPPKADRPFARLRWCAGLLAVVAIAAPAAAAVPAADDPDATVEAPGTPILGGARLTAEQIAGWYRSTGHTPRLDVDVEELAQLFLEEGALEGVRGDVAFAQSALETAYFAFPDHGQVRPEDHNFAGIGAFDDGRRGSRYPDDRTGVRAQMQLLRGYAERVDPEGRLLNPPANRRGAAPTWEQMGGGNWATDPAYARKVLEIYNRMLLAAGLEPGELPPPAPEVPPVARVVARPEPPPPPPPPPNEAPFGYWLADAGGQVHDRGVMRFLGSAASRGLEHAVAGMGVQPGGEGYWLVTSAGEIHDFGTARYHGSLEGRALPAPAIGLAPTPSGRGYWIALADGSLHAFGDAPTPAPTRLPPDVVAIVGAPTAPGFWLLSADGVLEPHGTADLGPAPVAGRAVAFTPTPTGAGGWVLDETGAVHALGDATPLGDVTGSDPVQAVDIRSTTSGDGYWIAHADGRVSEFGDAGAFPTAEAGAPVVAVVAPS